MPLAQRSNLLFGVWIYTIVGRLRASWLVVQGLAERGKGTPAAFVEITATDAELGGYLCCGLAVEQGQHRLYTPFPFRRLRGG
jgi:hypothetical protein